MTWKNASSLLVEFPVRRGCCKKASFAPFSIVLIPGFPLRCSNIYHCIQNLVRKQTFSVFFFPVLPVVIYSLQLQKHINLVIAFVNLVCPNFPWKWLQISSATKNLLPSCASTEIAPLSYRSLSNPLNLPPSLSARPLDPEKLQSYLNPNRPKRYLEISSKPHKKTANIQTFVP